MALVHGYRYDPASARHDPHALLYPLWRAQLADRRTLPFAWYSGGGWKAAPRAWLRGYPNSYAWAYRRLAVAAALDLRDLLVGDPHDLLCHSLGSRVALKAISLGAAVRACVILNGAELVAVAHPIARAFPGTRFVNIFAKTDSVIDLLAENLTPGGRINAPAIGNNGMTSLSPGALPNWTDVVLDDEAVQSWAWVRGWTLRGDNPRKVSDHNFTYEWPGNWDLIRAALDGDGLAGLPSAG